MFSSFQYPTDAWFINESLAFYTSTSTFRNPIFDTQLEQFESSGGEAEGGYDESPKTNEQPQVAATTTTPGSSKRRWRLRRDQFKSLFSKQQQQRDTKDGPQSKLNYHHEKDFGNFCDNLIISIRGKAYVLELNFKRRLNGLRKFLNKNLPWVLPNKTKTTANHWQLSNSMEDNHFSQLNRYGLGRPAAAPRSASRPASATESIYYDALAGDVVGADSRKFWKNIQPDSTKSLESQQARLLSRLERAKRDSQKLFNMERNFRKHFGASLQAATDTGLDHQFDESAESRAKSIRSRSGRCDSKVACSKMEKYSVFDVSSSSSSSIATSRRSSSSAASCSVGHHNAQLQQQQQSENHMSGFVRHETNTCNTNSARRRPSDASPEQQQQQQRANFTTRPCNVLPWPQRSNPSSNKVSSSVDAMGLNVAAKATTTTTRQSLGGKRKSRWMSSGRQIRALASPKPKQLCIVCYTNTPNIVTLPCEHHDVCSDCFIEIIYIAVKNSQYPLKCVLCRQKVERIRCSKSLLLSVIEKNRIK